jgi:hypothetical protein
MFHVEIKVKHNFQTLKDLLDYFGNMDFPKIYTSLNPQSKDGRLLIPYLGDEDSEYTLALKMMAMEGLKKKTTTEELVKDFSRLSPSKQLFIAYNLSHELKVASLVASIAMSRQNSNVYEIGPCFGFSSRHFSHLMREKDMSSKPIGKVTTIESNEEFFRTSEIIVKIAGKHDYVGEIKQIYGEGIGYLRTSLRNNDIVFSSIAEPLVVNGIFELSVERTINIVVSFSEKTDEEIERRLGKKFEDLLDSRSYEVFPFEDKDYNTHVHDDVEKIGVLVFSKLD